MLIKTKVAGILALATGVALFVIGMSTYLWTPVTANLIDYSTSTTVQYGYSNTEVLASAYKGGLTTEWESVKYNYKFDEHEYHSSFIGFYLPFNNDLPFNKTIYRMGKITVYVLPFISRLSVIKRGFDGRLVGVLLLIGCSVLLIRNKIIKVYM